MGAGCVGAVAMAPAGDANGGPYSYEGRFTCEQAGRYGVTVRVVPRNADLVTPAELGRVAWAGAPEPSAEPATSP